MAEHTNQVDQLLQKEMSRKEFLSTIGLAFLSVFGVGRFLNYLLKDKSEPVSSLSVYGGGTYGTRRHK